MLPNAWDRTLTIGPLSIANVELVMLNRLFSTSIVYIALASLFIYIMWIFYFASWGVIMWILYFTSWV